MAGGLVRETRSGSTGGNHPGLGPDQFPVG